MKRERVLHVLHARVVLYEKAEESKRRELHAMKQLSLFGNHLFIKIEWDGGKNRAQYFSVWMESEVN